jgi:hypothetical protein
MFFSLPQKPGDGILCGLAAGHAQIDAGIKTSCAGATKAWAALDNVRAAAVRERFSALETLAGHCDPLCQKCSFFRGRRANPVYRRLMG